MWGVLALGIMTDSSSYSGSSYSGGAFSFIISLLFQAFSWVINIAMYVWELLAFAIFAKTGNIQSVFMVENYKKLLSNNTTGSIFIITLISKQFFVIYLFMSTVMFCMSFSGKLCNLLQKTIHLQVILLKR